MSNVSIDIIQGADADFTGLMKPGERPIWTGRPQYGLRLLQPVGAERINLLGMTVGVITIWAFYPTIVSQEVSGASVVAAIFGLFTLVFMLAVCIAASIRQHVLSTLFYVVTNQRSIVCRRGRNWHFGDRLYVLSCPHSVTYPYEITPTRPFPSMRVGTLLDPNELQPFGFGLKHPGQPMDWTFRHTVPVAFEQIPDAQELLDVIQANAR